MQFPKIKPMSFKLHLTFFMFSNNKLGVNYTHVTEVKSVYSGLYEERIVWRQVRLELCFFILCFILQL